MKQYKDTLQYVKDNGVMRGDRTKKGRHGVFSPPDEIYDLSKGFPLCTLREIKPAAMVDELLWFISGSTKSSELKYKFFWEKWTAKEEDAIKYCEDNSIKYPIEVSLDPDTLEISNEFHLLPEEIRQRIGTIGNLYGVSWRNAPGPKGINLPVRQLKYLPKKLIERFIPYGPDDKPTMSVSSLIDFLDNDHDDDVNQAELKATIRGVIHKAYWSNFDQLNELIYKLKTNPNSSRHRVTAYLTDYMAFEEFSPQENVMDGRAALTACHTFFQCYVHPAKDENSKPKLDLKLTLTSSDVPVGRVYNIAQYALLTHMLAQVCDMEAGRLIISTGDAHIYADQFEAVETILSREPKKLPTLWLNPKIKDLYEFTTDDIKIEGYEPHPAVVIPVAI